MGLLAQHVGSEIARPTDSDLGRIRTCDRLIRSQLLYPLSYEAFGGAKLLLRLQCPSKLAIKLKFSRRIFE